MTALWGAVVLVWITVYELGLGRMGDAGRPWRGWRRRGCWWGAAALLALAGLPPLADAVPTAVWGEALQFALLAFGVAPLAVLARPQPVLAALAPWTPRRVVSTSPGRAWAALLSFLAVTIGWRLPPAVDALATGEPWLMAEAVTLVAGTWGLWSVLAGTPPVESVASPPRRIVLAAFAAWSVWIFAYVVGFSSRPFYPAYASGPTAAGTQEWVVAVLWAASAAVLVPLAFVSLARWFASEQTRATAEEVAYRHRAGMVLERELLSRR